VYPIPISTYLTVLAAIGMVCLNMGLNRLLTSPKKLKALQEEIRRYDKLIAKAMKAKDEKTKLKVERRLKKRMAHLESLRSQLFWEQMKGFFSMLVSFFILIFVLARFFGREPVAFLPIGMNGPVPLNFIFWYAICGMALGTLIQRALGFRITE